MGPLPQRPVLTPPIKRARYAYSDSPFVPRDQPPSPSLPPIPRSDPIQRSPSIPRAPAPRRDPPSPATSALRSAPRNQIATRQQVPPPAIPATYRLRPDSLGKSASDAASLLLGGMTFEALCATHRGQSCLADPQFLPHSAAPILSILRSTGARADQSTPPWSLAQLDAAVARGPHKGTHEHIDFMRQEFYDMVNAGQWLVLPYSAVRHIPNLKLSPTGVVPQRDRRPRPIVDYTFSGINDATASTAPDAIQFGATLYRFLQKLHRADTRRGPIYLSKTDISDAFMRVWLTLSTLPTLGAILPTYPDEEPLVAFPMILPMGWVDSPNYLCAVTETIADLANARFREPILLPSIHRLTATASTPSPREPLSSQRYAGLPPPPTRSTGPMLSPLNTTDVYMDDFLHATQLSPEGRITARSILFDCIDSVLRPLLPTDNPFRKEPISIKKLLKGDAAWETRKSILGWTIDTVARTIELPPHRLLRLHELLDTIPRSQLRTSRRKWQQLLGELRSMTLAIPGGRGLLSQLQSVLVHAPDPKPTDRLRLLPAVHDQLDDLRWITTDLQARPTRWAEAIDSTPSFLGTVDASGRGMGGTWLSTDGRSAPLLWRLPFDSTVTARLVTYENPSGSLTNSDLEQVALTCHPDILTSIYDVRERTICALSDNTAALSRESRGSTSTDAPAAYLCRIASMHQRSHRYRLRVDYLPGPLNVMADDLSRPSPVASLPPPPRSELEHDASLVEAAMRSGLSHGRRTAATTYWEKWVSFCQQHSLESYLPQGPDTIAWLQKFAVRVRDGRLSASGNPVRTDTVADALSHVGTAHTMADCPDPRHLPNTTTLHPRLATLLRGLRKQDSPPTREQPIPIAVLHHFSTIARQHNTDTSLAAADLLWLAFFFLLRPGEYLLSGPSPHPFTLADVRLWEDTTPIDVLNAPYALLRRATFALLIFSDQKNSVRGEAVGHARSNLPHACPVLAVLHRVLHLRQYNAPSDTPLCCVGPTFLPVQPATFARLFELSRQAYTLSTNIPLPVLHLKALRATGATALLAQGADHNTIKLLGRWKSESALRYLHLQSHTRMAAFAALMIAPPSPMQTHPPCSAPRAAFPFLTFGSLGQGGNPDLPENPFGPRGS